MGPKRRSGALETPKKRAKKDTDEPTDTPKARKPSTKKAAVALKVPSRAQKSTKKKEQSSTEVKSEQVVGEIKWEWIGSGKGKETLLVGHVTDETARPVEKIAGFDVDGTLIETKSGATFAKNKNDWKWRTSSVVSRIQSLWKDEGFHIVLFTNQGGVQGEGRASSKAEQAARVETLCGKLEQIATSLGVPVLVLAATASDMFRKPSVGMWNVMEEKIKTSLSPIQLSKSFFVGDAAGRPKGWKKGAPADFTCSDRKFAHNLKIGFKTPEEFFENAAPYPLDKVDWGQNPADWIPTEEQREEILKRNAEKIIRDNGREVVICVGMPGAGKSTCCKNLLPKHVYINQDTLGSADRCAKLTRENLNSNQSVVIDCTNPSVDHRRMYKRIAAEKHASARILYFNTPKDIAEHLNILREVTSKGMRSRVPQIAYRQYLGQFQLPTKELDLLEVSTIDFCPIFATPADREVFCTFTS